MTLNDDRDTRRRGDPLEDRLDGDLSVSVIEPAGCPVCNDPTIRELPTDWQALVDEGHRIDLVGCGNPWHYRGLDPDPLTLLETDVLARDHHDGGLLLPLALIALVSAVVTALALYGALHLLGLVE